MREGNRPAIITIPAPLVPHVREAVTYMLGQAGDEILGQTERRDPELGEPLRRFDAMHALLDALAPTGPDTAARVDGAHAPAMVDALREQMVVRASVAETAQREGRTELAHKYTAELAELMAFMAALDVYARDASRPLP
jgi:hypothetical protein